MRRLLALAVPALAASALTAAPARALVGAGAAAASVPAEPGRHPQPGRPAAEGVAGCADLERLADVRPRPVQLPQRRLGRPLVERGPDDGPGVELQVHRRRLHG